MARKSSRKPSPAASPAQAPPAATPPLARPTSHKLNALLIAAAGIAVYAYSPWGEYIWLDHAQVQEANYRVLDVEDFVRVWHEPLEVYQGRRSGTIVETGRDWRPIFALNISLDWALWGDRPSLSRAESILWHAAVVVGLYYLGIMIFGGTQIGLQAVFWATLLFAVHPLGVQSVTWISARVTLLCAAFTVAALLACGTAIKAQHHFVRWLCLAAICLFMAIGSKEQGFLMPLVATILFWPQQAGTDDGKARKRFFTAVGVLWMCALALAAHRVMVVGATTVDTATADAQYPAESPLDNFAMSAQLIWHYLFRTLVPYQVEVSDAWPVVDAIGGRELLAMLGLVALIVLTMVGLWKRKPWALGLAWFAVLVLPASGIVPLRHFHSFRYIYPAAWGVLIAALFVILPQFARIFAPHSRPIVTAVLLLCGFSYAFVTAHETIYWTDDVTMFQHAVAQDPHHTEALIELCRLSLERDDPEAAIDYGRRGLQQLADRNYVAYGVPYYAHFFYGVGLMQADQLDQAIVHFNEALRHNPRGARTYIYLGLAASKKGDRAAAAEGFFRGLELDPTNPEYGILIAKELVDWGEYTQAADLLRPYVQTHPDDSEAAGAYSVVLMILKRFDDAEPILKRLVEQQPEDATNRIRLASCQLQLGRADEARKNFEVARNLAPQHTMLPRLQKMLEGAAPGEKPE